MYEDLHRSTITYSILLQVELCRFWLKEEEGASGGSCSVRYAEQFTASTLCAQQSMCLS